MKISKGGKREKKWKRTKVQKKKRRQEGNEEGRKDGDR